MPLGEKMLSSSHLLTPKVDFTKWGLTGSSRPKCCCPRTRRSQSRLNKMRTHYIQMSNSLSSIFQNRDLLDLTLQDPQPWDREEDRRNAERLHALPRHTDFSPCG